jgi:hypothetical protein
MNQIQINFKELAVITYKHKITNQLMTIKKMHGDKVVTCKLLIPVPSKSILNVPFNNIAICDINNLEKL